MKTKRTLLALLCLLPLGAPAFQAAMVTEGSLTGISGWDPARRSQDNLKSAGGELKLYLQPLLAFREGSWLFSPNYDLNYSNVNTVLTVDENVFLFNQYLSNLIELGGAWRSRGGQRVGFKVFETAVNGTTAANETLNSGLYNYNDFGAKASWSKKTASKSNYSVGLAAYQRKYPNYVTLDAAQRHEKDTRVLKLGGDAEINWNTKSPFMTLLSLSVQSQTYNEALVIDGTGTTLTSADGTGTLRRDVVTNFGVTFPFEFGATKWGIGYSLESRNSNFNYLDSSQFVYMPNYNDYAEHGLLLSFAYDFQRPLWVFKAPEATLDADVHYRAYSSRLARKSDGSLDPLAPRETDNRYEAQLGLNSPVSEHWSVNSSMDFLGISSNNLDATTSLVNYKFYTFRLGARFNY
jgi:hypothetical protein